MKKNKARNLVNSMKLAGLMSFMTLIQSACDYNYTYNFCSDCNEPKSGDCRDCNESKREENPCDEKCDCNKNCGCGKKQCDCNKKKIYNKPKSPVKPVVEPEPKPEPEPEPKPEPEPEPKPEPECKTVTTTTYEHFCISGDANDVVNAAIRIVNSNQR